jgi:hypothetical protein
MPKIVFENNSYRTPASREELTLILNTSADSNSNKKGQNQKNLILSSLTAFAKASAADVEAGRRKSNFITGLKLIENYMQGHV